MTIEMSLKIATCRNYKDDFFKDIAGALVGAGLVKESEAGVLSLPGCYDDVTKFLNRILCMPVDLQNRLFEYFIDTLNVTILNNVNGMVNLVDAVRDENNNNKNKTTKAKKVRMPKATPKLTAAVVDRVKSLRER